MVIFEAREVLAASEADVNPRVKRWRRASLIAFKGAFRKSGRDGGICAKFFLAQANEAYRSSRRGRR